MPGTCSVCHVVGPPDHVDDFLCEECAHPAEIRTYCASCGARKTLVPEMGLGFLATLLPEVPHETGTAIRLERCPACAAPEQGLGHALVYRIRSGTQPLSGQTADRAPSELAS